MTPTNSLQMGNPASTPPDQIVPPAPAAPTWSEFLAKSAPNAESAVLSLAIPLPNYAGFKSVTTPSLKLFCTNPDCEDECFFDCDDSPEIKQEQLCPIYLRYVCRHCKKSFKLFALLVFAENKPQPAMSGRAIKVGEWPPFGPRVPSKVNALIGTDRDYFFKGRRAESLGMGIGAFGYYRRVVENQKDRIFDEIIRVSKRINAKAEIIQSLEAAKSETQFSKAVQQIKDGIPEILRIDGHNPLNLLHSALSEGLHSQSDETCLELATSIRVVLTELAERLGTAMKEHQELESAVSRLLKTKSDRPPKTNAPEAAPQV